MKKRIFNFEVETIESGQANSYGDSVFHFIVKNNSALDFSEHVIKNFCTKFLRPAVRKEEQTHSFQAYYTDFKKIDERTYEYKVVEPSTD